MKNFRITIKKRLILFSVFLLLALILILVAFLVSNNIQFDGNDHEAGFMLGFSSGGLCAFVAVMLFFIIRYRSVLKSEDKLKQLYIQETDERAIMIRNKVGGMGYWVSIGIIVVAAIIASFYNATVALTLVATLLVMCLLGLFLKIYYRYKY